MKHTNNNKSIYYGTDLESMVFAKNYNAWIINEFKPYLDQYVAEIGAGTGNFSALLLNHIKNLVVFEPSDNMYPLLEKRFKGNPHVISINDTFGNQHEMFEGKFDSIIYVNVLEHIENDKLELSYIYKSLRPGGFALFFVPALSFLYSEFDKKIGHYRRYRKNKIVKLFLETGFAIIKAKYFDFTGILPWYIHFVILKRPMKSNVVSLYDKLVVPIMQKIENLINPPIGKNLLLVVKKI